MLLVWGSGDGRAVMGDMPVTKCGTCGEMSPRTAVVVFKYWHVWYLFSFLTGRDYRTICKSCGAVATLDKIDARAAFPKDNIPFMKKKGWMVCAAAVFAFIFIAAIGNQMDEARLKGLLEAPAVGDLYAADLSRIPGSGYEQGGKRMYGGMLLIEKLEDGGFIVATSDTAYDKKSGWRSEGDESEYSVSGIDGVPLTLSPADFAKLHGDGILYDGNREESGLRLAREFEAEEEEPEAVTADPETEA